MSDVSRSLQGVRVGLICADRSEHDPLVAELAKLGAVGVPRAILGDIAAVAEMCAAVVVFVDGYDDEVICARLDGIERWRDGPTLIVVTDRSPSIWTPKLERERPVVVVDKSGWTAQLELHTRET